MKLLLHLTHITKVEITNLGEVFSTFFTAFKSMIITQFSSVLKTLS